MMSQSANRAFLNRVPMDPSTANKQLMTSTMHVGPRLLLLRKARLPEPGVIEDQGAQTRIKVKRLGMH